MHAQNFREATSLTLTYTVGGERRMVNVVDARDLKDLLDAVTVVSTTPGKQVGIVPFGIVDFRFADGSVANTSFVSSTVLDQSRWGEVVITDTLYTKVNTYLSRVAGMPIDILENN